jgi:hypothetical protein
MGTIRSGRGRTTSRDPSGKLQIADCKLQIGLSRCANNAARALSDESNGREKNTAPGLFNLQFAICNWQSTCIDQALVEGISQ